MAKAAKSIAAKTKPPTSGKIRGKNWSEQEQLHLLDVLEEIRPINPEEWDRVKSQHDIAFPGFHRTVATLQRVYSDLARVVEPTGDPNIPRPVKKAKIVRELIREKTDGTTGSPDDELMDDDDDDDDDDSNNDDNDDNDGDVVVDDDDDDPMIRGNNNVSFDSNNRVDDGEEDEEGDQLADFFDTSATIVDIVDAVPTGIRATKVSHSTAGVAGSVTSSTTSMAARGLSKSAKAKAAFNRRTAGSSIPSVSPKFRSQLQSMKTAPSSRPNKRSSDDDGFSFQNMMGMMMMQQQQERESAREERAFHAQQAREDRAQQQQFMSMMMMAMVGGGKKRARDSDDDDDDDENGSKTRKSPRKSPGKGKGK